MRLVAVFVVLLALPLGAQAQIVQPRGTIPVPGVVTIHPARYDPVVAHDLEEARDDIDRRRDNGELTRREARRLRREANRIEEMSARYGRDGLSADEVRQLQLRADTLANRAGQPSRR
jgi:hypothetical protein